MRLLTFLARRFAWTPHAATAEGADDRPSEGSMGECVVVFVHAETRDESDERRKSTLDHARKHVEWLARKKATQNVVLHSFAHLGGQSSSTEFGRAWMEELGAKLALRGYTVATTPFGWTSAWDMSVHGEGIAKVWKEI